MAFRIIEIASVVVGVSATIVSVAIMADILYLRGKKKRETATYAYFIDNIFHVKKPVLIERSFLWDLMCEQLSVRSVDTEAKFYQPLAIVSMAIGFTNADAWKTGRERPYVNPALYDAKRALSAFAAWAWAGEEPDYVEAGRRIKRAFSQESSYGYHESKRVEKVGEKFYDFATAE